MADQAMISNKNLMRMFIRLLVRLDNGVQNGHSPKDRELVNEAKALLTSETDYDYAYYKKQFKE